MADRRLTRDEGDLLRDLLNRVATLERNRNRGAGVSTGLPFIMGSWVVHELEDGSLEIIQPATGAVLAGSGGKGDPGPAGAQGPAGLNGTNGIDGDDGDTIIDGVGPPSAGTGSDGDYYLDSVTHLLWGPKVGGAWPASGVALSYDPTYSISDLGFRQGKIVGCSYPLVPTPNNIVNNISLSAFGIASSGGIMFAPVWFPWNVTFTQIQWHLTAVSTTAGATMRFGVYASSLATGLPTGVPTTLGTQVIDSTSGAVGGRVFTGSSYTFQRNVQYWIAMQPSSIGGLQIRGIVAEPAGWWGSTNPATLSPSSNLATCLFKRHADYAGGSYAAGLPSNPSFSTADVLLNVGAANVATPNLWIKVDS